MDRLWAPWRINYIKQIKRGRSCIFCKVKRERRDKKNFVILRSGYCFVVLNAFPYNNGHLMVVLNRHTSNMASLRDGEILDLNKTTIKMVSLLKKVLKPQGFNLGANVGKFAGTGVENHLHLHLVPRWAGDTNFMPVLAGTKIVSQSLKDLYKEIKKALAHEKI